MLWRGVSNSLSSMMKGIIFDLNGVFIQSHKLSDRFKEEFGVQTEVFLSALNDVM